MTDAPAVITHLAYVDRNPFSFKLAGIDGGLEILITTQDYALRAWARPTEDSPGDLLEQGSLWNNVGGACWAVLQVADSLIRAGNSHGGWALLAAISKYQQRAAAELGTVPAIAPGAPVH